MFVLCAVQRRFGGQKQAFVGELRHELLGRKAGIPRAREDVEHLGVLGLTQCVGWLLVRATPLVLESRRGLPALDGSRAHAKRSTSWCQSHASRLRLVDQAKDHLSVSGSVFAASASE